MEVIKTSNITEKDIFNMESSSDTMKSKVGQNVVVTGAVQVTTDEENDRGESIKLNYLVLDDGTTVSGNSVVVAKMMPKLINMLESSESASGVPITFKEMASGKGRAIAIQLL